METANIHGTDGHSLTLVLPERQVMNLSLESTRRDLIAMRVKLDQNAHLEASIRQQMAELAALSGGHQ